MADNTRKKPWREKVVSPETVVEKIEPGMSIFLSTGVAEPRTLVRKLITSDHPNLLDLELIQILSLGDAISHKELKRHKYRLKTFFSGWVADEAIAEGRVDLIPCYFSRIPSLIQSGQITVDVAFIQVTEPNEAGYCSFGLALDAARQAMSAATMVVGEINPKVPLTYGDTFVPVDEFDYLVYAEDPPIYFDRWPVPEVYDRVAANVASLIEDGSCLAFTIGPLFEALAVHLTSRRNLGVHTPFFTDALMDLIKSGAVTNRHKQIFQGKSVTSYALGTQKLMDWLHTNPLVEFQGSEKVLNPQSIGSNPRLAAVIPCRKADLSGRIAISVGKGNVTTTPGEVLNFVTAAGISRGGNAIFALPSRNREGKPNILLSIRGTEDQFSVREAVDMVVTEYGVAFMNGRSVRERAQGLIEIAHPDDREQLFEQAKKANMLYSDQIFMPNKASVYPAEIATRHTFRDNLTVRFRAIRPSDEEGMRRLFYRFSDEAVYYRYFTHVKAMPHAKMQQYVTVDYSQVMSIVGLVGEVGKGRIIAEARYVKHKDSTWADIAFVVDEMYHGRGLASFMYKMLTRLAKERGLQGFTADVLQTNKAMMKVFQKQGPVQAKMEYGEYSLTIPFKEEPSED
jgi:acyl-CoA hydrolase/GNAT superfamily N-acetyltransferase